MMRGVARSPTTGAEGSADTVFKRRPVLGRRPATVRLARCSRWVRGKSSENEFHIGPELRSMRPPRLLARSPTIRRPRPSLILPRPEQLSVTRQLTHEPARVLDSVVQLVQQGSSLQAGRMGDRMGHSGLLTNINYTV